LFIKYLHELEAPLRSANVTPSDQFRERVCGGWYAQKCVLSTEIFSVNKQIYLIRPAVGSGCPGQHCVPAQSSGPAQCCTPAGSRVWGSAASRRGRGIRGSADGVGVNFVIFIEMINVCWSFFSLYTVMQIYNFLNYYLWRSCITKQADYKIHNTNPYADTTNV
jgi:hypothetical protein